MPPLPNGKALSIRSRGLKNADSVGLGGKLWPAAAKVCRWLRGCGLNAAVLNCNGHSAVHKAAIKGNRAVCEWLLSAEGGLSTAHLLADRDGNTPASMARAEGFVELADWLDGVSAGHAHPHASESEGRASPSAQTGPY
jgi:hypothetical protein